jgi:hypothetical protein
MEANDLQDLGRTVGGATVVGGAGAWLFREKLAGWVRSQTRQRLKDVEDRMDAVEKAQGNHEGELMRIAEAMERTSENLGTSMTRLTVALERIAEGHDEMRKDHAQTALIVARVDERTKALHQRGAP